jgi:hypothetical protein
LGWRLSAAKPGQSDVMEWMIYRSVIVRPDNAGSPSSPWIQQALGAFENGIPSLQKQLRDGD